MRVVPSHSMWMGGSLELLVSRRPVARRTIQLAKTGRAPSHSSCARSPHPTVSPTSDTSPSSTQTRGFPTPSGTSGRTRPRRRSRASLSTTRSSTTQASMPRASYGFSGWRRATTRAGSGPSTRPATATAPGSPESRYHLTSGPCGTSRCPG